MRNIAVLLLFTIAASADAAEMKLPPLPDENGYAGAFAGTSHGALVVAGGANFPEKKPWEGGTKVWHDRVFILEKPDSKWKEAGKLPRPLAYGVSISYGERIICVGGSDATQHYAETFQLEWKNGKLLSTPLPALPTTIANSCGAIVGDLLYIAGGLEKPDSSSTLHTAFQLDLAAKKPEWKKLPAWPGSGRMLAMAASFDGAFWLIGGVDLAPGKAGKIERKYLRDAYRYAPKTGWKRIAELPQPLAAAPSPAPANPTGFFILGGDDGTQVSSTPQQHKGFKKTVLFYDGKQAKWREAGETTARVTVPCVRWNDAWIVPSGEMRPGVRSPEVWHFSPRNRE